jgi:hypothetical protein
MNGITISDGPKVPTGTEAEVCNDIAQRQAFGLNKYGVAVADNPLNIFEWMRHAYEEGLDQSVYLKRAMDEIGKSQSFVVTGINRMGGEVLLTTEFDDNVTTRLESGDRVVLMILKKRG